jgi:hypothetical protein
MTVSTAIQIEHKISASPPTPDIRADIVVRRFVPIVLQKSFCTGDENFCGP